MKVVWSLAMLLLVSVVWDEGAPANGEAVMDVQRLHAACGGQREGQ